MLLSVLLEGSVKQAQVNDEECLDIPEDENIKEEDGKVPNSEEDR